MSVKRYAAHTNIDDFKSDWHESKDGPMVRHEDYSSLEAKCAALAAELSAVDKIHNEAVFITDDHYEQCPSEVQKMIRSLAVLQIPAYDAFLAEVRAQGVDALNIQFKKCSGMLYADSVIETAAEFAAKLRQGAAL